MESNKVPISPDAKLAPPLRVTTLPVYPLSTSTPRSPRSDASHRSSNNSNYLSPPVTDSDADEVPWKPPTADDLASLDMHNTPKRKGKKRRHSSHVHRAWPVAARRADRPSKQLCPINAHRYTTRQTSSLNSWGNQSSGSISEEGRRLQDHIPSNYENRAMGKVFLTEDNLKHHDASVSLRARSSTTSKVRDWRNPDTAKSPSATGMKTQRRSTLIGDTLQPSTSLTNVVAVQASGISGDLPGETRFTASGASPGRMCSKGRNRSYRDSLRRRQSHQEAKLETPATITLRKASKTFQREQWLRLLGGSPEGVAISTETSSYSADGSSQPQRQVESITKEQSLLRYCTPLMTSGGQSGSGIDRVRSATAGSALTVAEVHAVTSNDLLSNSSRKHSFLVLDTMRKSSLTQFRSRNSITEVIWDKNDTPSTRSSKSHTTPLSEVQSPILSSNTEKNQGTQSSSDSASDSRKHKRPDLVKEGSLSEQHPTDTGLLEVPEELIGWSWSKNETDAIALGQDGPRPIEEESSAPLTIWTKTRRGRLSKSWEIHDSPSSRIESFPPLLDRKSTQEWCSAPLVDLNDPTAGRPTTTTEETIFPLELQNMVGNDAVDIQVLTSDPIDTNDHRPHSRKFSRVGEALGISRSQRRPSAALGQQKPYNSLVDLTKSVSQKATEIYQNLSDISLNAKGSRSHPGTQVHSGKESPLYQGVYTTINSNIWGVEGIPVVPRWRTPSSHGLYLDTSIVQAKPRLMHVAEPSEDRVGYP